MSYQNFNHNWVLFYDANTLELKRQVRLQDAYWFPAIAVYPDVEGPAVSIEDQVVAARSEQVISLLSAVYDADNMAALAVSTAVSGDENVVRAHVIGLELHLTAVASGQTTVIVTVDSNGKSVSDTFTVTVVKGSIPGDVNMDGIVNISDVTQLITVLMGSVLCDYDPAAADYNNDGLINITDAVLLINWLLNI